MKRPLITHALLMAILLVAATSLNVAASSGYTAHASGPELPYCPLPTGARSVDRLEFMPRSLQAALQAKVGEVVPPKAPFDATDVASTRHNRRLIFIWTRKDRWIIATEHGGLAYNDPVFAYAVSPDGEQASLLNEQTAHPETLCSTANELLSTQP